MLPQDTHRANDRPPLLAFVGGFLAAGKTTLILKSAAILRERGQRVGVIMNDQDADLVDTRHSLAQGLATREVAGGCFCCRFSDLIEVADQLLEYSPDVILAEPVGSCIDLSATILQPLRAFHHQAYRLAPLTVLLDPETADRVNCHEVSSEIEYVFRNQLAEADLICLTKRDLFPATPGLPFPIDFRLSAKTGEGVENWLNEILSTTRVVGAHILEVDYALYGAAEGALGWLNLHASLHLSELASPSTLCGPLLDQLENALTKEHIPIAHLKVFDRASTGWIKASIGSNGQEPVATGELLAEPAQDHELAINLRAVTDPDQLRKIVTQALANLAGTVEIRHIRAFRPAQPKPEHRFAHRV